MDIREAIEARHTVRRYRPDPIPEETVLLLRDRAASVGRETGIDADLVIGGSDAVGMLGSMASKNVCNYFVLSGAPADGIGVRAGYAAADLMLYAQTLGLNTWYIGGMTSKKLRGGNRPAVTAIAVGYGMTQGEPHRPKATPGDIADLEDAPQWFTDGVNAQLYAPTAMNRQDFRIVRDGRRVGVICRPGRWADQNKGLVMYHFEVWAGKGNFEWM